jgi:hypothetical protein
MIQAKERGKSARRIKEVEEIIAVNPENLNPESFRSVEWDPRDDSFRFNKDSFLLKKIAKSKGINSEDILKEILRREAVLNWMVKNKIKDYVDVCKLINEYYKDPEKILAQVDKIQSFDELRPAKKEEIKPMKKEEVKHERKIEVKHEEEIKKPVEKKDKIKDFSELFGLKVISEK